MMKLPLVINLIANEVRTYVSKYLVQLFLMLRQSTKTAVRISGARVLTSDKCVALLKECEEKESSKMRRKKERK